MSNRKFICIALTFFLFAYGLAYGQDVLRPGRLQQEKDVTRSKTHYSRFSIGLEAGINYCLYSQNNSWNPDIPNSIYHVYESGSGIAPLFSIFCDLPLSSDWGLMLRLTYDMKTFSDDYIGLQDCLEPFLRLDQRIDIDYKIDGAYIDIAPALRYNFNPNFYMTGGLCIAVPAGDFNFEMNEVNLTGDCPFNNGSYEVHVDTTETVKTVFSLELGIGYKFRLSRSIWLAPAARFQYMLTDFSDGVTMPDNTRFKRIDYSTLKIDTKRLHSLQLFLALWFEI